MVDQQARTGIWTRFQVRIAAYDVHGVPYHCPLNLHCQEIKAIENALIAAGWGAYQHIRRTMISAIYRRFSTAVWTLLSHEFHLLWQF